MIVNVSIASIYLFIYFCENSVLLLKNPKTKDHQLGEQHTASLSKLDQNKHKLDCREENIPIVTKSFMEDRSRSFDSLHFGSDISSNSLNNMLL